MARPTARVLSLLELLQSGGVRTVPELAGRLGVDERTVRRYADHLIDLDVPVESVRGRYGGYRLASGYRMPPLMLSDDEALAVAARPGRGPPDRAGDGHGHGERDGGGQDPPGPARAARPQARRRARLPRLHRPARRRTRPGPPRPAGP